VASVAVVWVFLETRDSLPSIPPSASRIVLDHNVTRTMSVPELFLADLSSETGELVLASLLSTPH